ncbi:hypothetical protein J8K62_08140 [Streptococcus suis]|uniref:Phage protein n=2 Tax=Streptococcus suis TaxID=1307 RepID=A0A126UMR8_STRSU|nr:hypothetical protein [Streptococcus suis]AGE61154.1 hypothetical protein SS12_005 [Streptococcus phage phiSS12]AGF87543.1 hypothetical protein phi891591_006 [Streptococcus phage phi891591]ANM47372.1 glycerate kinase [Streptococcus phage phiLP081102]ANM47574.1 glycerate kinase [Streptococcus phage phiZJ20091101-4]QBX30909.1 glycerate kinase [Streptococcus phage Javan578]
MNQEQITQALRLTNNDLVTKLSEEMTTKNLLAVQLTEAQQTIANLRAEITDLTQQLDEATKPEEIIDQEEGE